MSDRSTHLSLPFLQPAQAQKHVTVNETLLRLDALVQMAVVSATIAAQPASPLDGSLYILPAGKTGEAWGAMANHALAYWRDGAWEQITPRKGWIAFVRDTDQLCVFDGGAWTQGAVRGALGLGAAATQDIGTSGATIPLLSTANTWSANQLFTGEIRAPIGTNAVVRQVATAEHSSANVGSFGFAIVDGGGNCGVVVHNTHDGTYSSTDIRFVTGQGGVSPGTERLRITPDGATRPGADGAYTLGAASFRWDTVFASTGAINTSDAREKTTLAAIPEGAKRAVRRVIAQIGVYQWLDAIERKGPDGARLHVGVTAQAVRDAFAAEGLDARRWALFCEDAVFERVEIEPARTERTAIIDPETGEERDIETLAPARFEDRPKRDANGGPVTRLGVRADQLLWLAIAALAD